MAKKSATIGEYTIQIDEKNHVDVYKTFNNVKATLREVANEIGFEYDPKWSGRQFGAKLIHEYGDGKSAQVGNYVISLCDNRAINISKTFSNTKDALTEIAESIGFSVDTKWTTQQFGNKLIDYKLSEGGNSEMKNNPDEKGRDLKKEPINDNKDNAYSQVYNPKYVKRIVQNGKYGMIYMNRKVIIPCEYDNIDDRASENLYQVTNANKVGVFDVVKQKEIIPTVWKKIEFGPGKLISLYEDWSGPIIQFVDRNGQIVGTPKEDFGDLSIQDDNTFVKHSRNYEGDDSDGYALIDHNGNRLTDFIFDPGIGIDSFTPVGLHGKDVHGVIDKNGNTVIPFKYRYIEHRYQEGFRCIRIKTPDDIYDLNGKLINPEEIDKLQEKSEDIENINDTEINSSIGTIVHPLRKQKKGRRYGMVDANGKVVIPFVYNNIYIYKDIFNKHYDSLPEKNLFVIKNNNLKGVFDIVKQKEIIPTKFHSVQLEEDQYIKVLTDGENRSDQKYGLYSLDGNEIVPPVWDKIEIVRGKLISLYEDCSEPITQFVDSNGQFIGTPKEELGFGVGSFAGRPIGYEGKKTRNYALLDNEGNRITDFMFNPAGKSTPNGNFIVGLNDIEVKNWGFGVIDKNGNTVIPFKYGDIEFKDNRYVCKYREPTDYYDLYGNLLRTEDGDFTQQTAVITVRDDHFGVIDANSREVLIPFVYDNIDYSKHLNLFKMCRDTDNKHFYGVYDIVKQKEIVPADFENLEITGNHILVTDIQKRRGMYNLNGDVVIQPVWDRVEEGPGKLITLSKESSPIVFVDSDGQTVKQADDNYASFKNCGWGALVKRNEDSDSEGYALMDNNGELLTEYKFAFWREPKFSGDFMAIELYANGYYGVINKKGETVIPFKYDEISIGVDKFKCSLKNKIYIYDFNGKLLKTEWE